MSSDDYRANSARRLRLRKAVIHRDGPDLYCWVCRKPIDLTLKAPNDWAFSIDHYTPQSKGGDTWALDNCLPAHLRCNKSRGARPIATHHQRATSGPPPTVTRSRTW